MNDNSLTRGTSFEEMLSHEDFVRAIARSLLFDHHQVDDVVQQTWVAALQNRPRNPGSLRFWLGAIARNLSIKAIVIKKHRHQREGKTSLPPEVPSAEEIAEREALRREIVELVMELEEPYRSVIVLRYFEERNIREIAKRLRSPLGTVKTRLKRGLDLLREKLDRKHGGDRSSWCCALIPLAIAKTKPISSLAFASAAAALVLTGFAAWWIAGQSSYSSRELPRVSTGSSEPFSKKPTASLAENAPPLKQPQFESNSDHSVASSNRVAAKVGSEKEAEIRPDNQLKSEWTVSGRVLDLARMPVADAIVREEFELSNGSTLELTTNSDKDGSFALYDMRVKRSDSTAPAVTVDGFQPENVRSWRVAAKKQGLGISRTVDLPPGLFNSPQIIELILQPQGLALRGKIELPDGTPLANAALKLSADNAQAIGRTPFEKSNLSKTDAQGYFAFESLQPGRYSIRSKNGNFLIGNCEAGKTDAYFVLKDCFYLTIEVVDARGVKVPDAELQVFQWKSVNDEQKSAIRREGFSKEFTPIQLYVPNNSSLLSLKNIAGSLLKIQATAKGADPAVEFVDCSAAPNRADVTLVLKSQHHPNDGKLKVFAIDPSGKDIREFKASLTPLDGTSSMTQSPQEGQIFARFQASEMTYVLKVEFPSRPDLMRTVQDVEIHPGTLTECRVFPRPDPDNNEKGYHLTLGFMGFEQPRDPNGSERPFHYVVRIRRNVPGANWEIFGETLLDSFDRLLTNSKVPSDFGLMSKRKFSPGEYEILIDIEGYATIRDTILVEEGPPVKHFFSLRPKK